MTGEAVHSRRRGVLLERDRVSWVLSRGARVRLSTSALIDVAIATLAVLLIASPLLLTSDGFAPDFTNDLWLAAYQQHGKRRDRDVDERGRRQPDPSASREDPTHAVALEQHSTST